MPRKRSKGRALRAKKIKKNDEKSKNDKNEFLLQTLQKVNEFILNEPRNVPEFA